MIANVLAAIGRPLRESLAHVGFATRSFFGLMRVSPGAMRRPALISEQIHFIGNYSLVIIVVSGYSFNESIEKLGPNVRALSKPVEPEQIILLISELLKPCAH